MITKIEKYYINTKNKNNRNNMLQSSFFREYLKRNRPLYIYRDNLSNIRYVVGRILECPNYSGDDSLYIEMNESLRFITPNDYVIEFREPISTSLGSYDDEILCAALINKEFLQNNG